MIKLPAFAVGYNTIHINGTSPLKPMQTDKTPNQPPRFWGMIRIYGHKKKEGLPKRANPVLYLVHCHLLLKLKLRLQEEINLGSPGFPNRVLDLDQGRQADRLGRR
jgi:hypothetical protein